MDQETLTPHLAAFLISEHPWVGHSTLIHRLEAGSQAEADWDREEGEDSKIRLEAEIHSEAWEEEWEEALAEEAWVVDLVAEVPSTDT